ncbi:hypothetical protein DFH07DRAFT_683519, partial [Mycena maculata]
ISSSGQAPLPLPPARRPYVEPESRHDFGRMDVVCTHCQAFHWTAEKVVSSGEDAPKFGSCCNHGKVVLEALTEPPAPLQQLFIGTDPQSKEFRKSMAQHNTALSFTSLGVEDHAINNGCGPPIFRIHGKLVHRNGALLPAPGHTPTYAQLYIHEPCAALDYCMLNNPTLRRDTMETLQTVLQDNNQYAHLFRHSYEVLRDLGNDTEDHSVRLRVAPGVHAWCSNLSTADEVAVILPGDQSEAQPHDIRLWRRNGPLMRISDLRAAYTPLYYVLLFPRGESGWH